MFTYKISRAAVFLSVLFMSVIFSPHAASAAPCDMISSYGVYDGYKSTLPEIESGVSFIERPLSMVESGRYNEQNTGAGVTKLTWDAQAVGGRQDGTVSYELPNSYHCFGTPTTTPLSFVLPSGIVQSKNSANKVTFSTGKRNPIGVVTDQLFYMGNGFILPCAELGATWDGHLDRAPNTSSLCNQVDDFVATNPSIDSTGVSATLVSPWSISVQQEDEAIEQIAKTGKIRVQGAGITADIPATNCVRIAGPDPVEYAKTHEGKQPIKVVFMRDSSNDVSVDDFVINVNDIINRGFKSVVPYSTYHNGFVFYVDLLKQPLESSKGVFFHLPNTHIPGSCSVSERDKQIVFYEYTNFTGGYTLQFGKVVFVNLIGGANGSVSGLVFKTLHEVSHAFGGLNDEYLVGTTGSVDMSIDGLSNSRTTCSLYPRWDYRGSDNLIYGSVTTRGCHFLKTKEMKNPSDYYRPSISSLMNNTIDSGDLRLNVVGCGYLSAVFNDEAPTQENAQEYWPWCLGEAKKGTVIKDGIPPVAPAPTINPPKTSYLLQEASFANVIDSIRALFDRSISVPTAFGAGVYSASPGYTLKVNGSGFSATDNAVQLQNISTGEVIEILGIPSRSGVLSFVVPTTTSAGEYSMKAGAFNSPWSNSLTLSVLAPKNPTVTISYISRIVKLGQSTTIRWSSDGADTCIGTATNTVPGVWSNPGLNGSLTFVPQGTTVLTLTCSGVGGSKSASVKIEVDAGSKPVLSLKASSSAISTGKGTTLSWYAYNATSCTGSSVPNTSSTWNKALPVSGTLYVAPTQTTVFTLTCSGAGGTANAVQKVEVSNTNNLAVSCTLSPSSSVGKHQLVTRTTIASGGTGSYTYSWTGAEGLSGNSKFVSTYYTSSGNKTAAVTVTSGGQAATAQCPVTVSSSFGPVDTKYTPNIGAITPTAGKLGTKITLSGYGYKEGVSFVAVKKGTVVTYIKPETIVGYPGTSLMFDFDHSMLATTAKAGDVFAVSVINPFGYVSGGVVYNARLIESNAANFTFTPIADTIQTPVITSINPASGRSGIPVELQGNGFNSNSIVTAQQGALIKTFVPISVTPTSLNFIFTSEVATIGEFQIRVDNRGILSNPVNFVLTGTSPIPRIPATTTQVTADPVVTVNIVTRIGGKVLNAVEASGCISILKSSDGSANTGSCVRSVPNQLMSKRYTLEWVGGYPKGADTKFPPTITPSILERLGARGGSLFIDFTPSIKLPDNSSNSY